MDKIALRAIALVSSLAAATAAFAQPEEPAPVIQEQANPRGSGMPSETPPDPASADDPVQPAMPADPEYHAGPYVGALTPPPPGAFNKDYPVCSKTVQDSCINPGGK